MSEKRFEDAVEYALPRLQRQQHNATSISTSAECYSSDEDSIETTRCIKIGSEERDSIVITSYNSRGNQETRV